jgi:hypothetical protein
MKRAAVVAMEAARRAEAAEDAVVPAGAHLTPSIKTGYHLVELAMRSLLLDWMNFPVITLYLPSAFIAPPMGW